MNIQQKSFLGALSALILILGTTQQAIAEKAEYRWKMATSWSGGPLFETGAKAFAKRLEELSGGRFKVQVFQGGVLGKPLRVSDTVKNGVAELGHTWPGYDWGKDKTAVLFGGFAGSFDSERMIHWLYEAGGEQLWTEWRQEKFGLIGMPLYIRSAEVFLHSHKAVRSLDDIKGLKIRTTGAWLEIAKDLGASPVTSAGGDVYPMLERRAIDAMEWGTLFENVSPGFHRIAKYIIIPGVHQPTAPFELVVNKKVWEGLSDSDKNLIRLVAKLVSFESWTKIGQEDAKAYAYYLEQGNEIVELDAAAQKRAKELGLAWAAKVAAVNPWFKRVFEQQRKFEELWRHASSYRNVKN